MHMRFSFREGGALTDQLRSVGLAVLLLPLDLRGPRWSSGALDLAGLDYGILGEGTWLRHLRLGRGGLAGYGLVIEQRGRGKGRLSDLGDRRKRHLRLLLAGRGLAIIERCGLRGGGLSDLGDGRVRYLRLLLAGRGMAIMDRCGLGMIERCGLGMIERRGLGSVRLMVRHLELLLPGCGLGTIELCGLGGGRLRHLGEWRLRNLGLGLVALVECGRSLLLVDGKTGMAVMGIVGVHDVEMAETVNNQVSADQPGAWTKGALYIHRDWSSIGLAVSAIRDRDVVQVGVVWGKEGRVEGEQVSGIKYPEDWPILAVSPKCGAMV